MNSAQYLKLSNDISKWIKSKVVEANAQGVVIGLSGGIDSAVVAALAKTSLGADKVHLIAMPCKSDPEDLTHALDVSSSLGIQCHLFNLHPIYDLFQGLLAAFLDLKSTEQESKMANANLKSRLRMVSLYYYANKYNLLVAGTGNRSEIMLGYFTKYGDGGVDLEPIGDLYKTEVWNLARILGNIPEHIITKPPSAGLWENQTDEQEIGYSYNQIDQTLKFLERGDAQKIAEDTGILDRILGLMASSAHKRKMPPIFSIDRKEFSDLS